MDTLGIVECRSIASGAALSDKMLKVADIELIRAGTICPGKYIIYIGGSVSSVESAISMADSSGVKLVGSFVISGVSNEIIRAVGRASSILSNKDDETIQALGIVESSAVGACIQAADDVLDKADVKLRRIVLGQGIAGKAYFVVTGDLSAVNIAVGEGKRSLDKKLLEAVVIARPEPAVIKNLIGG